MADIVTTEQLQNASLDTQTLEKFVNGDENTVNNPRLMPNVDVGSIRALNKKIAADAQVQINAAKDAVDQQLKTLPSGHKGYATLADAQAAQASLPANTLVEVTNDSDTAKNGVYLWNGTTLTKSTYDPKTAAVADAKAYTDSVKNSVLASTASDATTKANTAEANAKTHADTNKVDNSDVEIGYAGGNLIGSETPKFEDLGVTSTGSLERRDYYGSVVLGVKAGDVLYLQNTSAAFTKPYGGYAFYSENPNTNQSQSAIAHTFTTNVDIDSGITYQKATVPVGAKYLVMNTRYSRFGDLTVYTWAVHKYAFSASYVTGSKAVTAIKGFDVAGVAALPLAQAYINNKLLDYEKLSVSTKNKFKGGLVGKMKISSNGITASANANDYITEFVTVEFGKFYTISGINTALIRTNVAIVAATSDKTNASFIKSLGPITTSTVTVYIDDATIKYIALPLTDNNLGTLLQAQQLPIQIEEGKLATTYEPYLYSPNVQKAVANINNSLAAKDSVTQTVVLSNFVELNKVRNPDVSELGVIAKDLSPLGMMYNLQGSVGGTKLNTSNNIFTQATGIKEGRRTIRANVAKFVDGVSTKGLLNGTPFTVPSGQFDNPNTLPDLADKYSLSGYVHPSIAYDSVGVAGFKYWMIASTLPAGNMNGATWEDEDMFVSNDAKNWQRIRSLYESDKTYTTATLRLPPQTLARVDARQNAILPVPAQGDTIEMSMPADNGAPAVDRQMTLLNGTKTPFKHDPAILIHGGFVYTYHSFHVPYAERDGGTNKFIVCVRTSNGVDWDVVRTDGSTMRLTEASSRTIFTKDEQGRYNYIAYFYSYGGSNPEIVKYGENDFEFIYGANFSRRYAGTTPYNFDFTNVLPFQDVGSFNHPATVLSGSTLYLINNQAVYSSTNRGVSFTKLPHYPMWLGGVSGIAYKKALCVGAGGKLILVEAQRYDLPTYDLITTGGYNQTNRDHQMTVYEYPSVTDFASKAANGFVDAYADVQLCKVNYKTGKRDFIAVSGLSNTSTTQGVNRPLQSVKVAELDFKTGDLLFVYVTLNARSGAEIRFGGIDIS